MMTPMTPMPLGLLLDQRGQPLMIDFAAIDEMRKKIMDPIGPLDIPQDAVRIGYTCYGIGCNGPCCDPYGNQYFQEIYSDNHLGKRTTLYKQQGKYGTPIPQEVLDKYQLRDGHDSNGEWDSRMIGGLF